ncbi:MAG: hypothetical protein RL596_1355 [Bacteroidota bacterium]|jgi:hypothetical protein
MTMKKILLALLGMLLFSTISFAQKAEIFSREGKAIGGYDAVAFFTQSAMVKGFDSLHYNWKDARWLFSSIKNKEAFIANPEKYAPQYGGYCAYGTADGHKAPTQSDTWTIIDNKLYFNYNSRVKEMWGKNTIGFIKMADEKWPALKNN